MVAFQSILPSTRSIFVFLVVGSTKTPLTNLTEACSLLATRLRHSQACGANNGSSSTADAFCLTCCTSPVRPSSFRSVLLPIWP